MPLDPIVSLAVALAEAPGTVAFFLGSGVSRDAGIPTGGEIMRDGVRRLYRVETEATEDPDDVQLDAWLETTGRAGLSYAELLAMITPDQAVRREYLAGFFEGREPGPTHTRLADLAARGIASVFVTTNFDRLLEHALQAKGIEPVVVASDADLAEAVPREHAPCFVLKPHGDYLRLTIRNTPEELATLEPGITAELAEVFSRLGLVVLGYSGSDEAIARSLRGRAQRYGLWWVSRGELAQPAADLVQAVSGRVIHRETAAEFLADLDRRLRVFEDHPSGNTPAAVHDDTMALVRSDDRIGLEEFLRRERQWFGSEQERVYDAAAQLGVPNETTIPQAHAMLRPLLDRRVASLVAVGRHVPTVFEEEIGELARTLERRPARSGYVFWSQLSEWSCAWLGYVLGALLVRLGRFESLRPLFDTVWTDANGRSNELVWLPSDVGQAFGKTMIDGNWISPAFEYLAASLGESDWLRERYPELFGVNEPRRSMAQFDLLMCIHYGLTDHRAVSFFSLGGDGAADLALRLHRDTRIRARIAALYDVQPDEFLEKAAEALSDVLRIDSGTGGFVDLGPQEVANLLRTGNRRS